MAAWWEDHPNIAAPTPPASAPGGSGPAWWEDHPDMTGAPGSAALPPEAAPTDQAPRKPTFGGDDYIKLIAEKHKVAPDFVRGLVNSRTQDEALKGVPLLGAGVDKAGAYASAIANPITGAGVSGDTLAERVTKNMALNQELSEDFEREHPVLSATSNITGGLLATAPLAATGIGAKLLGLTAKSLPLAAAASGGTGAAVSAADAALRGNDPLKAAMWGAGLGIAAPFIGRGIGAAWEAFRPQPASTVAGIAEVPAAGKSILRAASGDQLTEDNIQGKLAELGPLGMLADLGPNLRSHAEALVNVDGPQLKIGEDALRARSAGAPARMKQVVNETVGKPVDPQDLHDDLTAIQKHDAGPLYDQVHASDIQQTPALTEALARPTMKLAFQKGARMAADDGIPITPDTPKMAQLDYTKRAMDDFISTALKKGDNDHASILMNARAALVNELDRQVPIYAQARNAYAGPAKIKDAIDAGAGLFKKPYAPGQVESAMAKMTDSERMGYLAGTRSAIGNVMEQSGNPAAALQKLLADGWNQEKLTNVIGPDNASRLFEHLQREKTFAETASIVRDPRTAARTSAQAEYPGEAQSKLELPDLQHVTATGLVLSTANKILGSGARAVVRNLNTAKKVASAKALFAQGDDAANIASAIAQHPATRAELQAQRARIAHVSAFGGLPAPAISSVQQPQQPSAPPPGSP